MRDERLLLWMLLVVIGTVPTFLTRGVCVRVFGRIIELGFEFSSQECSHNNNIFCEYFPKLLAEQPAYYCKLRFFAIPWKSID